MYTLYKYYSVAPNIITKVHYIKKHLRERERE